MNRQDKWRGGKRVGRGIEWTQMYGRPGYTWNPTAGCMHGCTWMMPDGSITECYAKTIAEGLASHAYTKGFEHHYWRPHTLKEPLRLKEPAGIFVGSMADLFGHWVPSEQVEQVFEVMQQAHWHIFQTLSKYPIRVKEFDFPVNVWVGVSLPAGRMMSAEGAARALEVYLKHMEAIRAKIRFLSIEPIWFDASPTFQAWIDKHGRLPFEWVIIGAATNGSRVYQPMPEWVHAALKIFDEQAIPVFFKGNLRGNAAAALWREDFPRNTRTS